MRLIVVTGAFGALGTSLLARRSRKPVLMLPVPGRAAAALRRGEGIAPADGVGRRTWAEWLARRYGAASR